MFSFLSCFWRWYLLLLISWSAIYADDLLTIDTNSKWTHQGCEKYDLNDVNGIVRASISREQKEVYFSLDMSWMENILHEDSLVEVLCINQFDLENRNMAINDEPASLDEEIYRLIYVQVQPEGLSRTAHTSGPVDTFLLNNPCWMILVSTKLILLAADPIFVLILEIYLKHEPPYEDPSGDRGKLLQKTLHEFSAYHPAVVFAKLPTYPYALTCKFFTALTKRQFPAECPSKDKLFVYKMESFGFGGETNKVVKTFNYLVSTNTDQVYAQPTTNSFKWLWANSTICPLDIYERNPWACNFLPISKCDPQDAPAAKGDGWGSYNFKHEDEHATLSSLGIDSNAMKKYGDGSALAQFKHAKASWATLRLYVFIHRPNARTRYLIRLGLKRVHFLPPGGGRLAHHLAALGTTPQLAGASSGSTIPVAGTTLPPEGRLNAGAGYGSGTGEVRSVPAPCFSLHVRNGDVYTDFRAGRYFDRSLNGHVYAAINMTRSLGISDIFLATDNSSLFHIAPLEYPTFRWYAQRRPVQDHYHPEQEHLNEDDAQKEIANILADAITVGKCGGGLVGQGDGSLTFLFHIYQCSIARKSMCPPFFDLQKWMDKGVMPYIGKRHDASTYAAFGQTRPEMP